MSVFVLSLKPLKFYLQHLLFILKMKSALLTIIVLSVTILTCHAADETHKNNIPTGVYTYQEKVGEKAIPFSWQAEQDGQSVAISVVEENKVFVNHCSTDGSTFKWVFKVDGKHDLIAERHENTLTIEGLLNGEKHQETYKIDERPWYQPLSFSLQDFLNSEETERSFWVIRVDTVEVLALNAKKMGEEDITVGNSTVPTQVVEVRAEGFYSSFWHGTYWFRKSDNLFVEYKSVHGLPGTDETVITLVKDPDANNNS